MQELAKAQTHTIRIKPPIMITKKKHLTFLSLVINRK